MARPEPSDWYSHAGSKYFVSETQRTYEAAVRDCAAMGAHLVKLQTRPEKDFIYDVLQTLGVERRTSWPHYYVCKSS